MTRVFNFSAGPATLPEPVLRQAADEMLDWHGSGMSVMEMSHRGKEFIAIHAGAEGLLRKLLAVPANYKVLFMQGGAIGENAIVPMNLLRGKASADYVDTGEWSKKSIKEAKKYAKVNVAASAAEQNYTCIPPCASWQARLRLAPMLSRRGSRMSDIREDEVWTATNKDDERVVLEEFRRVFESYARTGSVAVAGFNVREFDVPFILGRCIVNDMLPYGFPRKGKDWQRVLDVRDSIPDGSLDQWSTALGIGRKAHASNGIWLFEPSEIEAQVSTDVVLTRTILRRLIPQRDAAFYE